MKRISIFIAAAMLLCSCGTAVQVVENTRVKNYPLMYEEKPVTLMVMPPINNTSFVDAKEYMYTTISRPLIEAGYYVISPMLAMDILKAESAYDTELFVDKPLDPFQKVFGVDAMIFCEINSWAKVITGIQTNIRYYIKSARTGEIIFDRNCDLYLDLSVQAASGSSALAALVNLAATAINTATTDHVAAARNANYYIFKDIPRGKYSPVHQLDHDYSTDQRNINITVK